jgi:hypothetical protein
MEPTPGAEGTRDVNYHNIPQARRNLMYLRNRQNISRSEALEAFDSR